MASGEPVVIVPYDPSWLATFDRLAQRVAAALGDLAIAIDHVGSTAVPGLAAKPIIDIDVVIASAALLPAAIACLATIGYHHRGDLGIAGREAFAAPEHLPRRHLYVCYVCTANSSELANHLRFRDHLRTHPADAARYAALKMALAERFRDDREGYTNGKTPFVAEILARYAPSSSL